MTNFEDSYSLVCYLPSHRNHESLCYQSSFGFTELINQIIIIKSDTCKACYPRLTLSLKPSVFYSAFKQEILLLGTGITTTSGGFRIELFICSVWSSWRNYFANWLQAKHQGTSPPWSQSCFWTSLWRAELAWPWVRLPSCLGFPSLGLLGAQLSGEAEGMGLSLSCQHTPLAQVGNGHWAYFGHETAAVTLLPGDWNTGSVPTTTAMQFPSLSPFRPTLSAWGCTGGRNRFQPKGKAHAGQDVLSSLDSSCFSWSVGTPVQGMQAQGCRWCVWSQEDSQ